MVRMPGNIGPLEVLVVLIIALVVFGPKRLPELGQSLGRGIREFKGSLSGESDDRDEGGQSAAQQRELDSGSAAADSGEKPVSSEEPAAHDRR